MDIHMIPHGNGDRMPASSIYGLTTETKMERAEKFIDHDIGGPIDGSSVSSKFHGSWRSIGGDEI